MNIRQLFYKKKAAIAIEMTSKTLLTIIGIIVGVLIIAVISTKMFNLGFF